MQTVTVMDQGTISFRCILFNKKEEPYGSDETAEL